MDSYIVRIYRRDGTHRENIAGLVELVEAPDGQQRSVGNHFYHSGGFHGKDGRKCQ